MYVWINAAWYDNLSARIHDTTSGGVVKGAQRCDSNYFFTLNGDVAGICAGRSDHSIAANYQIEHIQILESRCGRSGA
jgi:hypothetical protein